MSFSLTWDRDAEAELAACWLAARDRQRRADACAQIDAILATSPEQAGESREPGRRLMYVAPLWVRFEDRFAPPPRSRLQRLALRRLTSAPFPAPSRTILPLHVPP